MGADHSCCWGNRVSDKPPGTENARNGASDEVAYLPSKLRGLPSKVGPLGAKLPGPNLGHSVPNLCHEHHHGHHHHKRAQVAWTEASDRWTSGKYTLSSLVQEERNAPDSSIDAQPNHRHHHKRHTKDGEVMSKAALTRLGQPAPSVLDEHHKHHLHHYHLHHPHHEHPSSSKEGSSDKRNHWMADFQEQVFLNLEKER